MTSNNFFNRMQHTIISWDCSFRNFFHLIDSMAEQKFDKDEYEFIYVEQRTKTVSDLYNHRSGLKSLGDKVEEAKSLFNIRVIYLDQEESAPYHLGICNNVGLQEAQGEIVSVMDGDTLVKKDFLTKLAYEHNKGARVLNLFRHMAEYPVGVSSFQDWRHGEISFDECLAAAGSSRHLKAVPKEYPNKGPMISARKEYWRAIGGYDENRLWSTSASMVGKDTNTRLEMASGQLSEAMPDTVCVHPWHPMGYARKGRINKDRMIGEYFALQKELIAWCEEHNSYDWKSRNTLAQKLQQNHHDLIEQVIEEEKLDMLSGVDERSLNKPVTPLPPIKKHKGFLAKAFAKLKEI